MRYCCQSAVCPIQHPHYTSAADCVCYTPQTAGLSDLLARVELLEQMAKPTLVAQVHPTASRDLRDEVLRQLSAVSPQAIVVDDRVQFAAAQTSVAVRCTKLHPDAKLPTRATEGSVGLDLYAAHDASIPYSGCVAIDTGIAIALPAGYEAQVRPRSGLARKGIVCSLGTIDEDYRGAIGVTLFHHADPYSGSGDRHHLNRHWENLAGLSTWVFEVKAGDRIAQLIIAPVPRVELVEVASVAELGETQRGASGFGSTGR